MYIERLSEKNQHIYKKAIELYENEFSVEERRDYNEQNRVLENEEYHFDFVMDNDIFLGIMLYWETSNFIYLEHLAILPEFRNKGIGSQALQFLKNKEKTLILEIEPPIDSITMSRYKFYERNGFLSTSHQHIQAKYHLGDRDLELKILSYPTQITTKQYLEFQDYMTKEVGIKPNYAGNVVIRKLCEDDDFMQVAKLIYLTDPYIYPYWFDSVEDGQKVICEMINLPTIYNKNNITVAVMPNGEIAGMVVALEKIDEKEEHLEEAFKRANICCDERTHKIFTDYYDKMKDEQRGLYIANVVVDPMFRKMGIAAAMVSSVVGERKFCHLECVKENVGALRVYQRLGFKIENEYLGVFEVPCYNMTYLKKDENN